MRGVFMMTGNPDRLMPRPVIPSPVQPNPMPASTGHPVALDPDMLRRRSHAYHFHPFDWRSLFNHDDLFMSPAFVNPVCSMAAELITVIGMG